MLNTPFDRNRLLSFYSEIKCLKAGEIPSPRMAVVYPSYVCNQNCRYCFYKSERKDYAGIKMSDSQLSKVLCDLYALGVEGVEYCGGGEPTTHSGLIGISAQHFGDMKFGMLTNGTLLTDDDCAMIADGFSYIRFSIDSFDRDIYSEKRGCSPILFDKVIKNIQKIKSASHRRPTKLWIGAKILIDQGDYEAKRVYKVISNSVTMAKEIGIDSLQIKTEDGSNPEIYQIIEGTFEDYNFTQDLIIKYDKQKTSIKERCWLNPMQVTIDAFGDAYVCCYFQNRKDKHKICNIFAEDINEVWGSPKHKDILGQIEISECNKFNCRWHGYHEQANQILSDKFQLEFC